MVPLAAIDPGRAAMALGLAVSPATWDRLLASPRLEPRLLRLIVERQGLTGCDDVPCEPAERRLMALDQPGFRRICLATGAAWHAEALRATIMARPLAMLIEALGEPVYAFAVDHSDLAVETGGALSAEALLDAIEQDGMFAVAAWCGAIEPAAGAWFRLKLPMGLGPPEARHRAHGPTIVACAMGHFLPAEAAP